MNAARNKALGACAVISLAGLAAGQAMNESTKLLPLDGAANGQFGHAVAIDGGTALVGAFHSIFPDPPDSSDAYLFDLATGDQTHKLAPDGSDAWDYFGFSVALGGGVAVVGAPQDDARGNASGAVYLFDAVTGARLAKIVAAGSESGDFFGESVAIEGRRLVVGAPGDDDHGAGAGAAYVFDLTDPVNPLQVAKLLAGDGALNDDFGRSVSISGDLAVVGAWWDDDNGANSGSAYVFNAVTGAQVSKLLPADGAPQDLFGFAVSISGTTALVGARNDDASGVYSGSAYVFDALTGSQLRKIVPADGEAGDKFGIRVALDGAIAAIGAYQDCDNGLWSGSAYVFDISTGEQVAKLLASDGAASDYLGNAVGLDDGTVIVGAFCDDDNGTDSGSAYIFDLSPGGCNAADLAEPYGVLDLADINAFIAGFLSADPIADLNSDGIHDLADIGVFVSEFVAGCP